MFNLDQTWHSLPKSEVFYSTNTNLAKHLAFSKVKKILDLKNLIAIPYFSVPICLQITSNFQAKIRIRFGHVWTCSWWRKTFQVHHMWKKICNSQQSISSYTEETFLCLRTWNSARIKTSSYLRSMLVFADIKTRFSEPSLNLYLCINH